MIRPVHFARALAKSVKGSQPKPPPMRISSGAVVVSSTIGQTMVMIDGETNPANAVPVYNYDHTKSLTAGTVVEVLFTGSTGRIIGHNPS